MSEITENTLTAYKGPEFQQHLMWQLLVEPEYAEKTIPNLAVEYFDDPNLKRLFIIILEYFKRYEKVPNLQNQSIHHAINEFKTPNNKIEEESLFGVIKRVELWNERIINKQILHSGDVIQKATTEFIKQQEYRKLAESILEKCKNGDIRSKYEITYIEDKFLKITHIGEEEEDCEEVIDGIDKALVKEFRKTIPTGIEVIDALTGGGLGKGEIGVILTPSGVGKTTMLTKIANTAYEDEKNIAQIIFEDTKDQIKRKHYTIWAKSALSRLNDEDENARVNKIAHEKAESLRGKGRLIIKKFSQENTTMRDIRNWMTGYQKKYGFKFDLLVLDYLDCLESHKKSPDRNEAELAIIKGFESLASDFDIPAWTAIQTNRSGFDAEYVEAHQSGGSIKRIQKAHFFMSVAKTKEQKEAALANIRIIKARFAQDGQTFNDAIFNNDTMEIRIEDDRYKATKMYGKQKHYDENDIDKIENAATSLSKIHTAVSQYTEGAILEKLNDDTVNDTVGDAVREDLLKNYLEKSRTEVERNAENIRCVGDVVSPIIDVIKDVIIQTEGVNEGITEGVNDGVKITENNDTELFEIDGAVETEGASEGVNEGVSEYKQYELYTIKENDSFEWNGKSGKTTNEIIIQPEVKLEDVKQPEEQPKTIKELKISAKNIDINEIEKSFLDPDELYDSHKSVREMLIQERKNQQVIKKD